MSQAEVDVESIQMMSHDKLKREVSQQFFGVQHEFHVVLEVPLHHDFKHVDAEVDIFLVWLAACEVLRHPSTIFAAAFVWYIVKHLLHEYLCSIRF